MSITLAGFELKQVPGQYSQLTQSLAWDLILPECLRDPPRRPLLCSELSQEWPVEMGEFITVCSAVGRVVNSHRSGKKADFSLHLLWRASQSSRVRLEDGSHAECLVQSWIEKTPCNSAVAVEDDVVFMHMHAHACTFDFVSAV